MLSFYRSQFLALVIASKFHFHDCFCSIKIWITAVISIKLQSWASITIRKTISTTRKTQIQLHHRGIKRRRRNKKDQKAAGINTSSSDNKTNNVNCLLSTYFGATTESNKCKEITKFKFNTKYTQPNNIIIPPSCCNYKLYRALDKTPSSPRHCFPG